MSHRISKAWGTELVYFNSPQLCAKRLLVKPGWRCSLHRHRVKSECFIVERGRGGMLLDGEPIDLTPGVIVEVPTGSWHMFWCPMAAPELVLLETSTHHDDEDVERQSPSRELLPVTTVPLDDLEVQ
jgi:mannose-6-phosphate isomerase-like protein (cupin superfamily)